LKSQLNFYQYVDGLIAKSAGSESPLPNGTDRFLIKSRIERADDSHVSWNPITPDYDFQYDHPLNVVFQAVRCVRGGDSGQYPWSDNVRAKTVCSTTKTAARSWPQPRSLPGADAGSLTFAHPTSAARSLREGEPRVGFGKPDLKTDSRRQRSYVEYGLGPRNWEVG
jgi:hypothetical protein